MIDKEDLLTLHQAADLFGKTTSNISYLIQYDRINKYNKEGQTNGKGKNRELRVSRQELAEYFRRLNEHV
jgi:hypothetical protein